MSSISIDSRRFSPPASRQPKPVKVIGFFYKIKDTLGKTRGYLLGTVHSISSALNFKPEFDEKIQRSFDKSTDLITEITLIDKIHTLPELPKFHDNKMEIGFTHAAKVKGMPIHGLETEEFQLELLKKCWVEFEKQSFEQLLTQKARAIQLASECFKESSEEKLKTLIASHQIMKKEIIDDRNKPMTEKIDSFLRKEKGRFFIAIGVDHLGGDQGICKLLEKRHWTVEKVYPSIEKTDTQTPEQLDEDPIDPTFEMTADDEIVKWGKKQREIELTARKAFLDSIPPARQTDESIGAEVVLEEFKELHPKVEGCLIRGTRPKADATIRTKVQQAKALLVPTTARPHVEAQASTKWTKYERLEN